MFCVGCGLIVGYILLLVLAYEDMDERVPLWESLNGASKVNVET